MTPHPQRLDPARMPLILWAAQLASVAILTGLIWWLPGLIELAPSAEAQQPLLIAGIAAIPLVLVVGMLLRPRGQREDVRHHSVPGPAEPAGGVSGQTVATRSDLARYAVVVALAELPVLLGLVMVLTGGARSHGVLLGLASLLLLLIFRPRRPS